MSRAQILIVDDDPRALRVLEGILEPEGHGILIAATGHEALDIVTSGVVDVALLDVVLPDLSGVDVCRRIKSSETTQFIPVVMITVLTDRETRLSGIAAGADDFVTKPVDALELRTRVQSLIHAKQLHDELNLRKLELEAAYRQIVRHEQRMKDFFAGVSHDLRTPLTAIMGNIDNLAAGVFGTLSDAQLQRLDRARFGVDRLRRLVDDLLMLSRMDHGDTEKIGVACEPCRVDTVIRSTVTELTPLAERAGVSLEIDSEELHGVADTDALSRVIENLVGNAIKFTPRGGRVYVRAEMDGRGHIHVSVEDTGVGIQPTDMEQIFERFYRVKRGDGAVPGLGLGLPISKQLVELQGGSLSVKSRPGTGSTFAFTLKGSGHHAPPRQVAE